MAGNNDTGDNLFPVSLTPVNSFPLVSLTQAINTKLQIPAQIFVKGQNGPTGILIGLGGN
jgi:hypothetical protein